MGGVTYRRASLLWDGYGMVRIQWVLLSIALVAILAGGLIGWLVMRVTIATDIAKIEQLRTDSADVDPAQAEDVIGQVTQVNQRIAEMRTWDGMFVLGLFIPDEWSSIEPIPVPRP
jgi:uncharacterized membrane protein SpoIIM required for sporulation